MMHFYVIKVFDANTGEFRGYHTGNGWRTSDHISGAKAYTSKANANRSVSYHGWGDRNKSHRRVEIVCFEAKEVAE